MCLGPAAAAGSTTCTPRCPERVPQLIGRRLCSRERACQEKTRQKIAEQESTHQEENNQRQSYTLAARHAAHSAAEIGTDGLEISRKSSQIDQTQPDNDLGKPVGDLFEIGVYLEFGLRRTG